MSVSASNVKAFASEFDSIPDATVELFIGYAKLDVNANVWRGKTDFGIILMTCHLLKMKKAADAGSNSGAIGPVTSEKVGDLSVTYGSFGGSGGSGSDSSLGMTSYGQEFLRVRKSLVITPMVVS